MEDKVGGGGGGGVWWKHQARRNDLGKRKLGEENWFCLGYCGG